MSGQLDAAGEGGPDAAVERILELVRSPGERGQLVEAFARAVLRRVPGGEVDDANPVSTAVALVDAFDFVDERSPGEARVRLVDPRVTIDGSRSTGTVVQVSCEDRRFIVTTVREELHRLGHRVTRVLHPVFGSERDTDGRLTAVRPARGASSRESFLQVELGARVPLEARATLVGAVNDVLDDVFSVTGDFLAMREQVTGAADRLRRHGPARYPAESVAEGADLLKWLLDENFVLEGCCHLGAVGSEEPDPQGVGRPRGVLARPGSLLLAVPDDHVQTDPVVVARTAQISRVHRQVPMHRVDVAELGADGDGTGVFRLVGVFSRKAAGEPAVSTPVLRAKLRRILELEDVVEGGYDEATIASLFQVLPKEELFETDVESLREMVVGLAAAEQRSDVRALLEVEPADNSVSALISVPQELYSSALRRRVERFLVAQLDGVRVDANVSVGEGTDAILRLVVQVDGPLPEPPLDSLEREVRLLCRTWDEELAGALSERLGDGQGARLAHAWADWFPAVYREAVAAGDAVDDVLELQELASGGGPGRDVAVVLAGGRDSDRARLKVFSRGRSVDLSRFLPIVESLGLWAVEEVPYALGGGDDRAHLHVFSVVDPAGGSLDIEAHGTRLAETALAMWDGLADVDSLNRLVLRAGLSWEDVAVLRAYRRYRTQVGTTLTTEYMDDVLVENAGVAKLLVELFAARFDPDLAAPPEDADELARRAVAGCDAVPRLDHDRILRGTLALVEATLRTNRYLRPDLPARRPHLALKMDSSAVPDAPRPVPYREVFVHGPDVEGVHLRWGPVARGGIRWSERPDDYRSEVLGLMRAQVLKNAVIVPTGAKGGFVVRRPRHGPGAGHVTGPVGATEVRRAYETFVTSLLEVTDNVVSGGDGADAIVAVPRRRDGDDPYLVVAADRGTATFSDVANCISEDLGFWLGDAFASGGSKGYDHKKLAITARGAWVAVRQHLAELDVDLDGPHADEPVTVVGIGDMSGDVLGNGMLRSDRIHVVAAFDHRDIFLDPSPDPADSYRERARLFALSRSSWQDYDRDVISPGGGVWSRLEKRVPIGPEVRAVLKLHPDIEELAAAELIRAILMAPVTILFAGGIGTFVRASDEPDRDIDDRVNAEVRVEASRIRARVVGEGANLSFTQRARIEYSRHGGHINTDAIDNSGGVDLSDREVNLKILLRSAVESGDLDPGERDGLLAEVSDEVVSAVLHDCTRQSNALSRAQSASPGRARAFERLMAELEQAGVIDRALEALPSTREMVSRAEAGAGLSRPELAVLLAGSKRRLTAGLMGSGVPDQRALRSAIVAYFPEDLARRFDHLLDGLRVRRELIASQVANEVVDRMGVTFASRVASDVGADQAAVAAAWWVARGVVGASGWWRDIDGDPERPRRIVPEQVSAARTVLDALTRAYLRRGDDADVAAAVERDRPAALALEPLLGDVGSRLRGRRRSRVAESLVDGGLEPDAAARWACVRELEIVADAAEVARDTGRAVTDVAGVLFQVEEALGIDRLVERLGQVDVEDDAGWARAAVRGLLDDLDELRRVGARCALETSPGTPVSQVVAMFLATRQSAVSSAATVMRRLEADSSAPLDAIGVATRAVRRAVEG